MAVRRITAKADFAALAQTSQRASSGVVTVRYLPSQPRKDGVVRPEASGDGNIVAVAYAIGTHVGNAVVRNRIRRRIRSLLISHELQAELQAGMYLFGARPGAADASFGQIRHDLLVACRRAWTRHD